jgi:hypothetical protein
MTHLSELVGDLMLASSPSPQLDVRVYVHLDPCPDYKDYNYPDYTGDEFEVGKLAQRLGVPPPSIYQLVGENKFCASVCGGAYKAAANTPALAALAALALYRDAQLSETAPTTEDKSLALNPWTPMAAPIDVKHLGKLGEESGELSSAASRCLIQGIEEREPVTGKLNREWLEDEIADVRANSKLVIEHFCLDEARIEARALKKEAHLRSWHGMLNSQA